MRPQGATAPAILARRRADAAKRHALLAKLWKRGVPVDEIAEQTGYANGTCVSTTASALGLPVRHRRYWTPKEDAELRKRWENGASLTQMATVFGRNLSCISKHAHEIGLPKRSGGQRSIRDHDKPNTPELIAARRAKFKAMWEGGVPSAEIQAYFGWKDRRHAQVWARVLSFPTRPKQWAARLWTEAEDARLREMYDQGHEFKAIGGALDRTAVAITGRVAVLGLPPRKRHVRLINPNRAIKSDEAAILEPTGVLKRTKAPRDRPAAQR